jgi:hypothetical protein
MAEADLYGELGSIFPAAKQLSSGAHRAKPWCRSIILTVMDVLPVVTLWYQYLQGLRQQFFTLVAEKSFRLSIDERDFAVGIGNDHGSRRRLKQGSKLVVGPGFPWSLVCFGGAMPVYHLFVTGLPPRFLFLAAALLYKQHFLPLAALRNCDTRLRLERLARGHHRVLGDQQAENVTG